MSTSIHSKLIYSLLLCILLFIKTTSFSQTYASEELRQQAEISERKKAHLLEKEPLPIESKHKSALPDISLDGYMSTYAVTIVSLTGEKLNNSDLEEEAANENKIWQAFLHPEKEMLVFKNRETGHIRHYSISIKNNYLYILCESCDFPPSKITITDNGGWLMDIPSQDEGVNACFRYHFNPSK